MDRNDSGAALAGAATQAERSAFYERIGVLGLTPLWEVLGALVPPQPKSPVAPVHFRYDAVRPHVLEAGRLISAEEAERRVLVLENPALRGQSCLTQSLYAGLQLILPGEVAPAHRHTQTALRLVLDGEGAYTAVDGERTTMRYGDFIITPSWTFHDHGNVGPDPVVWLDGLDIPLVRFLDAGFAEKSTTKSQADTRARGRRAPPLRQQHAAARPRAAAARADAGVRLSVRAHPGSAARHRPRPGRCPLRLQAALRRPGDRPLADADHRHLRATPAPRLRDPAVPQQRQHGLRLPRRRRRRDDRRTGGNGEQVFDFAPRDVFVVPSWHAFTLAARSDTLLFSFSDRPVQQVLGLWREQRMA